MIIYENIKSIEVERYFGKLMLAMMSFWEAAGEEILHKTEHYYKVIGTLIDYIFLKSVNMYLFADYLYASM